MKRSGIRDFITGLFVLAGILALAYLSISIGGFEWGGKGGMILKADFNQIAGLTDHAPVKIAGVRVGEVTKIDLLPEHFQARVTMDLVPTLQLSSDTYAAIVTSGMLGDRYVELQPGGDDRILKSGEVMSMTKDAMVLEHVLDQIVYGITNKDSSATKPAKTGTKP